MASTAFGSVGSPESAVTFYRVGAVTVSAIAVYVIGRFWNRPRLPPGPLSFPIIGSLLHFRTDIREDFRRLAGQYGDIMTIYLGGRRVIVLNTYNTIKEAFVKQGNAFSGRPQDNYILAETNKLKGIVLSNGERWHQLRQFLNGVFREFGIGRSTMEEKIMEEIGVVLRELESYNGKPFDTHHLIEFAVSNIIWSIIFGKRRDYRDPKLKMYIDILNETLARLGSDSILMLFPFLRHMPGDPFKFQPFLDKHVFLKQEFRQIIEEHRRRFDPNNITNITDAYLKTVDDNIDDPDSIFTDSDLEFLLVDLFVAGSETTTPTLQWALLYMIHHPEMQSKVQEEIDRVIGRERAPSMQDKAQMPFTEACILETQRFADIVPLGLPRMTMGDVTLRGYSIPSGTDVCANLYNVHRDPQVWRTPYQFNPSHFLDDNGRVIHNNQFMPFSTGKRSCIGEPMAKMELFLVFTSMLQRFTFTAPPGETPTLEGVVGNTHVPTSYSICANKR